MVLQFREDLSKDAEEQPMLEYVTKKHLVKTPQAGRLGVFASDL
jgi:hypothetical protein